MVLNELQHADDAAYASHTTRGHQDFVISVNSWYARPGLNLNLTKAKVIAQRASGCPQIFFDDTIVPVTDKLTNLKSIITSD